MKRTALLGLAIVTMVAMAVALIPAQANVVGYAQTAMTAPTASGAQYMYTTAPKENTTAFAKTDIEQQKSTPACSADTPKIAPATDTGPVASSMTLAALDNAKDRSAAIGHPARDIVLGAFAGHVAIVGIKTVV
ncbi:MAG: hypothetical protein WC640_02070 [Candidatus Paceibacterota bacterium]|jgi:hypothetical protein